MASATRTRRNALRAARSDDGFTLAEVVVSFGIFAIVASVATLAVVTGIDITGASTARVAAANIAQQDLARARTINPGEVSAEGYPREVTAAAGTFTVHRDVAFSQGGDCPATRQPEIEYYVTVTDTVTWPNTHGRSVEMSTVIAC